MKIRFEGLEEREAFNECVRNVEGGTISPGGAAILLGVSRQMVHKLINTGRVRAWSYFYRAAARPEIEISVRDLVRYGIATGRATLEDFGFRGEIVQREFGLMVDEGELARIG